MLLVAHPLHADRPARYRPRQQCRIGRGIIGAIVTVATRSFD